MVEKEFMLWLETQRRSLDLRLDSEGRWFHDGEVFAHSRLIETFNRGIDRHDVTGEPIIRVGQTWCYFHAETSPHLVVRVIQKSQKISEFLLNSKKRLSANTGAYSSENGRLVFETPSLGEVCFTRAAQAALIPFLTTNGGRLSLLSAWGPMPIKSK